MNKAQLIEKIAGEGHWSKAETEKMLDLTIENIRKAIKKGDDVKLVGFGTFLKAKRSARKGRNPQTGKEIQIKAHSVPRFRPGKEFKEFVR
jgi:DNA-binding protein HU-beta